MRYQLSNRRFTHMLKIENSMSSIFFKIQKKEAAWTSFYHYSFVSAKSTFTVCAPSQLDITYCVISAAIFGE